MIKLNKKGDVVMLFPGDRYDKVLERNMRDKVRGLVGDEYVERCRQFIGSIPRH
jgi:hypothetical protein